MNRKSAFIVAFVMIHLLWAGFLTVTASTVHLAYGQIYGDMYPSSILPCAPLYVGYIWHPFAVTAVVLIASVCISRIRKNGPCGFLLYVVLSELLWSSLWLWGLIWPLASTTFRLS